MTTPIRLCGYGSDDCANPGNGGFQRTSNFLDVIPAPQAAQLAVAVDEFAVRYPVGQKIICPSDSGGAAFVEKDNAILLAGIIRGNIPNLSEFSGLCVRVWPFRKWINDTTGLNL